MTSEKGNTPAEKVLGPFIIANAVVWGAVMVGTAFILKGTGLMPKVLPILGGGAGFCVVILPGAMAARLKKLLNPAE